MLGASTNAFYQLIELQNAGRKDARGVLRLVLSRVDRHMYAVIRERRASHAATERHDVLSLLLQARDEDGQPLTDAELRDELMSLVLAGHETTANSLAWTFERLLRTPRAYDRLRELVRAGGEPADAYVEATIHEGMRVRPVIPMIVRMVKRRWQLGDFVVPAGTPVAISIAALHHREDVYPDPHSFRPERFVDEKPGTYTWIPFGGGIRRCLGASLAMAEQREVLRAIAQRTDLTAPDAAPEQPRQRNVTMIPNRGGRVVVRSNRAA
jgi:cytochrome P450